jgi:hypothetical protein
MVTALNYAAQPFHFTPLIMLVLLQAVEQHSTVAILRVESVMWLLKQGVEKVGTYTHHDILCLYYVSIYEHACSIAIRYHWDATSSISFGTDVS